jgi:CarD family transcriptional regulator
MTPPTTEPDPPPSSEPDHGLEVGQSVVHPQHGTATIVEFEQRMLRGEERTFAVLQHADDDLVLRVPLESLADIGVREMISEKRAEDVLEALAAEPKSLDRSWQKRRARMKARIQSGEVIAAAEVVRDLTAYGTDHNMPNADRRMYEDARARVVNELVVALGKDHDEVDALVDRILNGTIEQE